MTRIGNDLLKDVNVIRDGVAKLAGMTADGTITQSVAQTPVGRAVAKSAGAQAGGWSAVGNALADDDYFGIKAELDKKDKAAAAPAGTPTINVKVQTEVVHKNSQGQVIHTEMGSTQQQVPVAHHG
jgi:hypothetical protein